MTYVAFIAPALAVVAIAVGFYYVRAGRKRTQLRYDVVVERVFATGGAAKISIDDELVSDPHEVRLWLQANGNKDIQSTAFDDELVLVLGVPLATMPASGDTTLKANGSPGQDRVVVPKQLFKCGSLVYASMIVDGEPSPELHGGLADVDVVKFSVADAGRQTLAGLLRTNPQTIFAVGSTVVAIVGGLVGLLGATYVSDEERADEARVLAQQMIDDGSVSPRAAIDPAVVEMIRRAVDDALNSRGIEAPP